MAQRIYLVPVPNELLELYERLAAATSEDAALKVVDECERL